MPGSRLSDDAAGRLVLWGWKHPDRPAARAFQRWRIPLIGLARDRGWVDVTRRWFLNHPALLSSVFVVALVGIFATLLVIGPPDGER